MLSNSARAAGASSVFSASQAADAMYYLASSGMSAQQMTQALPETLNLAAAGGLGKDKDGSRNSPDLERINADHSFFWCDNRRCKGYNDRRACRDIVS